MRNIVTTILSSIYNTLWLIWLDIKYNVVGDIAYSFLNPGLLHPQILRKTPQNAQILPQNLQKIRVQSLRTSLQTLRSTLLRIDGSIRHRIKRCPLRKQIRVPGLWHCYGKYPQFAQHSVHQLQIGPISQSSRQDQCSSQVRGSSKNA